MWGGRDAQKLFEARAITLGAMRFFVAADEEFEISRAVGALVFVKGHSNGFRFSILGFRL
jgi:hypothetical protein